MKNLLRYLLFVCFCWISLNGFCQEVYVLGTAQDGGFPHIGCQKQCLETYEKPEMRRMVTSLALVDESSGKWWLFEATPDIRDQLHLFQQLTNQQYEYLPEGIFITHAHMGHYSGLMQLGREALGANQVPVYTLPKLSEFLKDNGPWSQLVKLQNIELRELSTQKQLKLNNRISIKTYQVPHRDEFSETAGFEIQTTEKNYLFIPDINKWGLWEEDIVNRVSMVDIAFLDASFFANGEIPNRDMSQIPHPFVKETMNLFENESDALKSKVHFIHLNHTNPLLWDEATRKIIQKASYRMAEQEGVY